MPTHIGGSIHQNPLFPFHNYKLTSQKLYKWGGRLAVLGHIRKLGSSVGGVIGYPNLKAHGL